MTDKITLRTVDECVDCQDVDDALHNACKIVGDAHHIDPDRLLYHWLAAYHGAGHQVFPH